MTPHDAVITIKLMGLEMEMEKLGLTNAYKATIAQAAQIGIVPDLIEKIRMAEAVIEKNLRRAR